MKAPTNENMQLVLLLEITRAANIRLRASLTMIAIPKRADGTYSRSREECEVVAKNAIAREADTVHPFLSTILKENGRWKDDVMEHRRIASEWATDNKNQAERIAVLESEANNAATEYKLISERVSFLEYTVDAAGTLNTLLSDENRLLEEKIHELEDAANQRTVFYESELERLTSTPPGTNSPPTGETVPHRVPDYGKITEEGFKKTELSNKLKLDVGSSKDWCKGFCRTCGTGCGQYCEQIHRANLKIEELEGLLKDAGYKWCTDSDGEFWVKESE